MKFDITFKKYKCKCGGYAMSAEKCKYQNRYKLYCGVCKAYICFAKTEDKPIIAARELWLKEHDK